VDKSGKSYAEIDGTYTNDRKETKQTFKIRYAGN
jgi:hypothetical protein